MKKKIFAWTILIILIICGVAGATLQYSYSTGQRSGKLVKLSKKGFLPKTYEGTLDLGSGDSLTWQFSVHDEKLGEKLTNLSGQNVTLEYRELLWKIFYDTKYDITGYKIIEDSGQSNKSLCRLVQVLRQDKSIVEQIRPMIQQFDPSLLSSIRKCQN
ncbi:MAG: hypothetical protein HN576_07705 [Bacteriovoracaceae bacterium]|jgi:hypothetical protein|nr:hypothetical protein [Bacteriovoracaceae bacterium]